jgi:glycosyltransferase involved in cell wall biosynthesis
MASALAKAGAELTLVLPSARHETTPDAAAIATRFGVEPSFSVMPLSGPYPAPFGFRGMEKLAHASKAALATRAAGWDLIYTRNLPVVLASLSLTGLPIVYETYRPWPAQSRQKSLLFRALRGRSRLRGLVLHSEYAAASYRRIGYEDSRLLVAHNGIDASRFADPLSPAQARRRLGLEPDGVLAVYTGHISPQKGLGVVLDAALRTPGIRYLLVGSSGQGPIERRASALPNVEVLGWQPPADVPFWLMAADILLVPPTRGPLESVGNTVLPIKTFQYLASGRAIAAPATPDLGEVLHHGDNALLVAPDDLDAFVAALSRLAADPALRQRLGERGRATALDNTWDARARRILGWIDARAPAEDR